LILFLIVYFYFLRKIHHLGVVIVPPGMEVVEGVCPLIFPKH
jgi:hypothetical protein